MNFSAATLSDVIGQALDATGLTDRQIEAKTGISRMTLKRRLADGTQFKVAEVERLATLLNIPVSELAARAEGRAA